MLSSWVEEGPQEDPEQPETPLKKKKKKNRLNIQNTTHLFRWKWFPKKRLIRVKIEWTIVQKVPLKLVIFLLVHVPL